MSNAERHKNDLKLRDRLYKRLRLSPAEVQNLQRRIPRLTDQITLLTVMDDTTDGPRPRIVH